MAAYTEFDREEHETFLARIQAEQAVRDHQPVAQTVHSDQPIKAWELTPEWLEEDERLKEEERVTYMAWKEAFDANPRHR